MRALLLVALSLLLPIEASAAPVVTVKGHTSVRIVGIYPGDEGAVLVGQLLDRDLGTGIPERTVEVTLAGHGRVLRARTDAEGEFRLLLPAGRQTYHLQARFAGDATYAPDRPESTNLDITKLTPELQLEMARELDLSKDNHELQVVTRAEGRNVSLPVSLRIEGGDDLGTVTTGATGRAGVRILTSRIQGPGSVVLQASFAGNTDFNPVRTELEVLAFVKTTITLRSATPEVHTDEEMQLSGTVADSRGPIRGAAVGLEAMGRHVASTLADEAGNFFFELRAKDFPPGSLDLAARFTPSVTWRRASTSPPVQITILPPTPIPVRLYAIPVAFTALVMIALLLVRFWPAFRSQKTPAIDQAVRGDPPPEPIESGVRLARTSLRSFVKPAMDIHGTVWNPVDRCPVPRARILIEGQQRTALELRADEGGRFVVPGLPPGTHRVLVSKPGFVSESFRATIPHRGSLHGLRVDLVQVRVRLLEIYREAAVGLLPQERLWARWTPRELARHVGGQAGQREPSLESLTRLLEQAYWARVPLQEQVLSQARALARAVRS